MFERAVPTMVLVLVLSGGPLAFGDEECKTVRLEGEDFSDDGLVSRFNDSRQLGEPNLNG